MEQIVDQQAHLPGVLADPLEVAPRLPVQAGGMFRHKDLAEAVDGPQGGAQVVGDGIGETLQLLVGGLQLSRAHDDAFLQLTLESPEFVIGPLAHP